MNAPPVVSWLGFDESDRPLAEHQANARLIAAAPELLAALRQIVSEHDYSYLDKGIGTATGEGRKWLAARAAVSKAEGR